MLDAAGFELRMRLATLDTHDEARRHAEALLGVGELAAFTNRERERVKTAQRRTTARA